MISNIVQNELVNNTFLILEAEERKTTKGSPFLRLTLGDKSGSIIGNYWSPTPSDFEEFIAGKCVEIKAKAVIFNGLLNLNVNRIEADLFAKAADFHTRSVMDPKQMFQELLACAKAIKHPGYRLITQQLYEKNESELLECPAAVRHHSNYAGGLMEHTLGVLRYSEGIMDVNSARINTDLLYASAILHDIGKIKEYDLNPITGAPLKKMMGKLLGHIFEGASMIKEAAMDCHLTIIEMELLIHSILSHHGKLEWGSPVQPQTVEAIILHQCDLMDSRLNPSLLKLETPDNKGVIGYSSSIGSELLSASYILNKEKETE